MLYFAYGLNMNHAQMAERCSGNVFLGRAVLVDYRFVYDGVSRLRGGGVGNILVEKGGVVWGGLYEISQGNLDALDKFEGYPEYYQRKEVTVIDDRGQRRVAMVYFREGQNPNQPSESYRQEVLQGAKDCGLPESYVEENL